MLEINRKTWKTNSSWTEKVKVKAASDDLRLLPVISALL
jgi:hypothetical protein